MPSLSLIADLQGGWENFIPGFRTPILTGLIALVVSLLVTPFVRKFAISKGAVDDPTRDDRRVHTEPTPRWGGIAIFIAFVVAVCSVLPFAYPEAPFPPYLIGILLGSIVMVVYGALDDLHQYSAKIQLAVLLLVGVGVQFFSSSVGTVQITGIGLPWLDDGWLGFGLFAIPLTAIYIFVVTKTMDTIDGIDGLSCGISTIAATTLGVIATLEGQPRVALLAMAIAGASLGFLRYNYNPAKIFMGTGGAQTLGFLLASLSIVGAFKTAATLAVLIPLLVFGIPLFDAVFVMTRRVLSRTPITQPDKRHLHHTLLGTGLNQRQTVWILYLIAMALSGLLLFLVRRSG
ncbi:MAG: undecaprenyl/decaprenyl-phosphate alpha-N-acetylglucosaminyl 1-phosphate transferase [Armatimonadetes bacterium]|nr:undecaprenyl/decaprenyl-phosphate alpha-N-acetylglucosaminyl 1-phosphate transferase [Armatimonadota bacterium]